MFFLFVGGRSQCAEKGTGWRPKDRVSDFIAAQLCCHDWAAFPGQVTDGSGVNYYT